MSRLFAAFFYLAACATPLALVWIAHDLDQKEITP